MLNYTNGLKEEEPIRLVPQLSLKALEAYSRMPLEKANHDKIKRAIFEHFGLNPLEYRDLQTDTDETFKEYAIRITRYFDHWKDSEDVQRDYDNFYELMSVCNLDLQTYLQEKEPKSVADLLAHATAYQLAHKNRDARKQLYRPPMLRFQSKENIQSYENVSANIAMFRNHVWIKRWYLSI